MIYDSDTYGYLHEGSPPFSCIPKEILSRTSSEKYKVVHNFTIRKSGNLKVGPCFGTSH